MSIQKSYDNLYAFLGEEGLYDYRKELSMAVLGIRYEANALGKGSGAHSCLRRLQTFVSNCKGVLGAPLFEEG